MRTKTATVLASLATIGAVAGFGTGAARAGGQSTHGPNAPLPIASDLLGSQMSQAQALGKTNPRKRVWFAFIFTERHLAALEAQAERGFKHHLTVAQFAARYGALNSEIRALERYLARYRIKTVLMPGDVDLTANGTIAQFEAALKITERDFRVPARRATALKAAISPQVYYASTSQPTLPRSLAKHLVAILGTNGAAIAASNLARTPGSNRTANATSANGSASCNGMDSESCQTPKTIAKLYGLNALYRRGYEGQGQTLGIVTYATPDRKAGPYYWKHVLGLKPGTRTLRFVTVDGGAGRRQFDGTSESDLDIEMSGGIAPDANIVVYAAANDSAGQVSGLFAAASQDVAGTVSVSWGVSDTILSAMAAAGTQSAGYAKADDEALLEFDAQGQASFIAAGDYGAYTAYADLGTTNLSTSAPSDSPYTTSAGGTTLPFHTAFYSYSNGVTTRTAAVTVSKQRAWGWDYLWPAFSATYDLTASQTVEDFPLGGGGGFSSDEPTPIYQHGVSGTSSFSFVQYLTPTAVKLKDTLLLPTKWTFDPTPTVQTGTATGRATPDLAADADPYTGYEFYAPAYLTLRDTLEGGGGGTSFVAPLLNGAAAVIDSALHRRVGFWNPLMYKAARSKSSPFTQLAASGTANDNLYYTNTPGDVYNPGDGLGVPNLAKLESDFAKTS